MNMQKTLLLAMRHMHADISAQLLARNGIREAVQELFAGSKLVSQQNLEEVQHSF